MKADIFSVVVAVVACVFVAVTSAKISAEDEEEGMRTLFS